MFRAEYGSNTLAGVRTGALGVDGPAGSDGACPNLEQTSVSKLASGSSDRYAGQTSREYSSVASTSCRVETRLRALHPKSCPSGRSASLAKRRSRPRSLASIPREPAVVIDSVASQEVDCLSRVSDSMLFLMQLTRRAVVLLHRLHDRENRANSTSCCHCGEP